MGQIAYLRSDVAVSILAVISRQRTLGHLHEDSSERKKGRLGHVVVLGIVGQSLVLPGCRERCICQAGGRLRCRPFQCRRGLGCILEQGVRLCKGPLGKGSAICRMVPGGLFTTFDGFQGKVPVLAAPGAYELAALAGANSQDPAWFRVVTEYPPCSACPTPRPWVIIRFRDGCVAVGPNREVWVSH
ncbi:IgGFc-binding protein-like [Macrotis lagotis]|uniref:IgGFc-binding protein-like n=1 Tax=Macrotis lagotis TaxID=92651 RepID=UPI003D69F7F9